MAVSLCHMTIFLVLVHSWCVNAILWLSSLHFLNYLPSIVFTKIFTSCIQESFFNLWRIVMIMTFSLHKVGCGVGNTIFPLVARYPDIFIHACDFSPRAVNLVKVSLAVFICNVWNIIVFLLSIGFCLSYRVWIWLI